MKIKQLIKDRNFYYQKLKRNIFNFLMKKIPFYSFVNLQEVALLLTFKCELSCIMCGHRNNSEIYRKLVGQSVLDAELSLEGTREFIDYVSNFSPDFILTGAEPLENKDCMNIARYIKSKGANIVLQTNGLYLSKYIGDIVKYIDRVQISLDGNEETNDIIRGRMGLYRIVVDTIKNINLLKEEKKTNKPVVDINFTINDINYKLLSKFPQLMEEENLQIERIIFRHLFMLKKEIIEKSKIEVKKGLGIDIKYFPAFLYYFDGEKYVPKDLNLLVSEISKIKSKKYKNFKVSFFPNLKEKDIKEFYISEKVGIKKCIIPYTNLFVMPDGNISICPCYQIGNISDKNIDYKLNPKAVFFRKIMQKDGLFSICKYCDNLYS